MDYSRLEALLKTLKDDLLKAKVAQTMQKPVPQVPVKPEPIKAKQIDRQARIQQMSADPNFRQGNMAGKLRAEQDAENQKAKLQNEAQDKKYKQALLEYHENIKHWPMQVLHGDKVLGAIEDKNYSVERSHPEHLNKESENLVEHAHKGDKPFRILQGKTHRLTVKAQGGGPTYQLWVTPNQFRDALTTGWHIHDFKDQE